MAETVHYNIAVKENGYVNSQQLQDYLVFIDIRELENNNKLFWVANISNSSTNFYEVRAKTNLMLCSLYLDRKCDGGCNKLHLCKNFLISHRFCQGDCPNGYSHDAFDGHNLKILHKCKQLQHFRKNEVNHRVVMPLIRASFPRLCKSFQRNKQCQQIFCGYLHLSAGSDHQAWGRGHNQKVLEMFNLHYLKEHNYNDIQTNIMLVGQHQQQQQQPRQRLASNFPPHWPKNYLGGHQLSKINSNKFHVLMKEFVNSMGKIPVRVKDIQEVINWEYFEKYSVKKRRMEQISNGTIDEMHLYHGTDHDIVDSVCAQNFDHRLSGRGAWYGQGSYFSTSASYSHKFCTKDMNFTRYMFLADVLVGRYTKGYPDLKRPPAISKNNLELYDSVVDDVRNPSMYVVFERDQCYPRYLISYTLWKGANSPTTSSSCSRSSTSVRSTASTVKSRLPSGQSYSGGATSSTASVMRSRLPSGQSYSGGATPSSKSSVSSQSTANASRSASSFSHFSDDDDINVRVAAGSAAHSLNTDEPRQPANVNHLLNLLSANTGSARAPVTESPKFSWLRVILCLLFCLLMLFILCCLK